MFEQLENRRLMSADLVGETLLITGTSGNDTFVVTKLANGDINVMQNGVDQGTFDVDYYGPEKTEIELHAGSGHDVVTLDPSVTLDSAIYGEAGNDSITGGSGEDWINAGVGNDTVHGGAQDDMFVNPVLAVGAVAPIDKDVYFGDAGTEDRVSYQGRPGAVSVTLDGVANDGAWSGVIGQASWEADNVNMDVEDVSATDFNDYILGNVFSNNLGGYGGNDTVHGNGAGDTLWGGNGNDYVSGGEGGDWIFGDAGNDQIYGNLGGDSLRGGQGSDTIGGGAGSDTVEYVNSLSGVVVKLDGIQNDGSAGENDWVKSDVENVTGSDHADSLSGNNGNNVLDGRNGHDTIRGFGGNDTLIGGFGNDKLFGGDGDDSLSGGFDNDTLWGDAGNDVLDGGAGVNSVNP
jgi:Ca2+-binding RTX toxin-like protein